METSLDTLLIAVLSTLLGTALGVWLSRRGTGLESRQQMETRLRETEQKLQQQQAQMTEHFNHTAALVNNLTRSYRDLHDYLAASAQQLGDIDIQPVMLADNKASSILGKGAVINPPLDYAPKKGTVGTLSESYGLREDEAGKPPGSNGGAYADV